MIDTAMEDNRPAKQAVRMLWLNQAKHYNDLYPDDDVPLYLTLSGAKAHDIKLFAEHNLIKLTEVHGIAAESQKRVVAIERSNLAVTKLLQELPGLEVVVQEFKAFIGGDSLIRFPAGRSENFGCAKIVNLDFQEPLSVRVDGGVLVYPIFNWIDKLAQIHSAKKPTFDWCLCLTLNSDINWPLTAFNGMRDFLKENFARVPDFGAACEGLMGDIYGQIRGDKDLKIDELTSEDHQKILMAFVPKKIAHMVHSHNWQVVTTHNLRYGGDQNQAPMVTWVFTFQWDTRASSTPEAVYRDCLKKIFTSVGYIAQDGTISTG